MLSLEVEVWATVFGFPLATPFSFAGFPFPILGQTDGVERMDGVDVVVYPNPSQGRFTLEGAAGCTATLWSADGQQVRTWLVESGRETVDTEELITGLYYLELVSDSRREVLRIAAAN